jgi:hypothetical protein
MKCTQYGLYGQATFKNARVMPRSGGQGFGFFGVAPALRSNACNARRGYLGALHTMAEGLHAVDFHQSNCKKPRVRPLDPSRYDQSPKTIAILNYYFLKKAADPRRKFGSDGNGNPNYGREAVGFFSLKNESLTRSWRRYIGRLMSKE